MRIVRRQVVTVFAQALALLRHIKHFTVVALAVEEIFAPGDAIADLERIAAHVLIDAFADFRDPANDFMAKNSGTRIWPSTFVGMNIGAADRRHAHAHQDLAAPDRAERKVLQNKGRVRRVVNGRPSCASRGSWHKPVSLHKVAKLDGSPAQFASNLLFPVIPRH
jgi:hypothetical protein